MDIGRAFSFVFDDERWLNKVLLGGLISLIPLIGQFVVAGYGFTVTRNLLRGSERPLPEWNEFGDMLVRGLFGALIQMVYALPVALLVACFATSVSLGAAAGGENGGGAIAGTLALCLFPLMLIGIFVLSVLGYAAVGRYLATDDVGAAFQVGEVVASVRNHLTPWLMLLLLGILAGVVASLGILALGVGVLFTSFYAQCVIGHGLGQVLRQTGPLAAAQPPVPPYPSQVP